MAANKMELKAMVRGAYDLQELRIQTGLRLCANFRAKLSEHVDDPELDKELASISSIRTKYDASDNPIAASQKEIGEKAESIIKQLKASYKKLTTGIAKNRELPKMQGFVGDELISSFSEIVLVGNYIDLEKTENKQFRLMGEFLNEFPVYTNYLEKQIGIGPVLAGVLISTLDPAMPYPSSWWKYAGLDVVINENGVGEGRSRRESHLIDREYIDKNGKISTKKSITYNPWLKSKLMGVTASSFIRAGSRWRKAYDDYKNRINCDPNRVKLTVGEWKKRNAAGEDVHNLWPPGRIDMAAKRYMVKQFLLEFYNKYREIEGLPYIKNYAEAKFGKVHRVA